jgi:hypothetical protein
LGVSSVSISPYTKLRKGGELAKESEAAYITGGILRTLFCSNLGRNCFVLIREANTYKRR